MEGLVEHNVFLLGAELNISEDCYLDICRCTAKRGDKEGGYAPTIWYNHSGKRTRQTERQASVKFIVHRGGARSPDIL